MPPQPHQSKYLKARAKEISNQNTDEQPQHLRDEESSK